MTFLLLLLISAMVLARSVLVPESFGKFGSYRGDAVTDQRNMPMNHRGAKSCKGCHPKQWDLLESGGEEGHMKVSCETCHDTLVRHASGETKDVDKKIADMPINDSWTLCAKCHRKLEGRPPAFPQIVFDSKHLKGEKLEGGICKTCHDPHSTMYEEPAEEEAPPEKKEDAK